MFHQIEAEFGVISYLSKTFIGALSAALCLNCLDANKKINHFKFIDQCQLLSIFINHNKLFELEALFAIESLDHRIHDEPSGKYSAYTILIDRYYA